MNDIDVDEFDDEDFVVEDEYDASQTISKQLDVKSQWLSTIFSPDCDIRATADKWGIRRHIWHKFWDRLMETERYSSSVGRKGRSISVFNVSGPDLDPHAHYMDWEPRTHPVIKNGPPFLRGFKGTMWERHMENIAIARAVSEESYRAACEDVNPNVNSAHAQVKALHTLCVRKIAGVDVYWDGEVEDDPTEKDLNGLFYRKLRRNKSETKFGTLRVWPFPFTALFRYDDVEEHTIFSMSPLVNNVRRIPQDGKEQMEVFVKTNTGAAIEAQKELRLKIRSMDAQTCAVYVGKGDEKRRQIEGQLFMKPKEPEKDSADLWKNKSTNEIVSTVPGFHFEIKTTPQAANEEKCLAFVCGNPETGVHPAHFLPLEKEDPEDEIDEFDTGPRALALPSLGIEDTFNHEDKGLHELTGPDNIDPIFLDYVRKLYGSYRDFLWSDAALKVKVLSYDFWLYVYSNDHVTQSSLKGIIQQHEHKDNYLHKDLFGDDEVADGEHTDKLRELYQRLENFDNDVGVAFWYMFWHAIELHNRARKARKMPMYDKEAQMRLDPAEPTVYNPPLRGRAELTKWLSMMLICKPDDTGCITVALLDALYQKLAELKTMSTINVKANWKKRIFNTKDVGKKKPGDSSNLETDSDAPSRQTTQQIYPTGQTEHKDGSAKHPLLLPSGDKTFRDQGPCQRACAGGSGCQVM